MARIVMTRDRSGPDGSATPSHEDSRPMEFDTGYAELAPRFGHAEPAPEQAVIFPEDSTYPTPGLATGPTPTPTTTPKSDIGWLGQKSIPQGMVQKRGPAPSQPSTTTRKTHRCEVPVPVFEPCLLQIEQVRYQNTELAAEVQRLRQEVTRLRSRNTALEDANASLDQQVAAFDATAHQIAELRQSLEYYRAGKRTLARELGRAQKNLLDAEQRFAHTETQLRGICQQRADRITMLAEDAQFHQRAKADLEQQVHTLLNYKQRAIACIRRLTNQLRRTREQSRAKSRRLAECETILENITQRLDDPAAKQT